MGKYLVQLMFHWLDCQLLMINNQLEMGIGRKHIPQLFWNMKTYASENISIWCFPYMDAKILTLFPCWPKFKEAGNYQEMGSNGKYKIDLIFYSGKCFVYFIFGIEVFCIFCILIACKSLEFFCFLCKSLVFKFWNIALGSLLNLFKSVNFNSRRTMKYLKKYWNKNIFTECNIKSETCHYPINMA